jgi:hypothetical protein
MKSAPKIGFDRFIRLNWAVTALEVRANIVDINDLKLLLDTAGLGDEAKKKTRTVLNQLWLNPRTELVSFANHGVSIFKENPSQLASVFCFGMAVATYPFFGKVVELIGRLSSIQGDCTATEVHRRMSEIYGEREGTRRMTSMVIQTLEDWKMIERIDKKKRIVRLSLITIDNDNLSTWLVEGILRSVGKKIPISSLQSLPILFPFLLSHSLLYAISNCDRLELHSEGMGNQFVSLPDIL